MRIEKMTDEKCLEKFLEFLEKRITVTTNFIVDPETENITHQVLQVSCGKYQSMSHPEPLGATLRVATGEEIGATVN